MTRVARGRSTGRAGSHRGHPKAVRLMSNRESDLLTSNPWPIAWEPRLWGRTKGRRCLGAGGGVRATCCRERKALGDDERRWRSVPSGPMREDMCGRECVRIIVTATPVESVEAAVEGRRVL